MLLHSGNGRQTYRWPASRADRSYTRSAQYRHLPRMTTRTSMRNPPSTKYQRPAERKFYVWQDRFITYGLNDRGWEKRPWRWLCTMCEPPSYGFRSKKGAWNSIMTVSLPRHMFVRKCHHEHVRKRSYLWTFHASSGTATTVTTNRSC